MQKNRKLLLTLVLTFVLLTLVLAGIASASGPTIVISEPVSNVVSSNQVDIKGYVTNANSLIISVNGFQQNVDFDTKGFFTFSAGNLLQGNNSVKITVLGSSGSTSRDLNIIYDPGALFPQINVTNYSDNATVNQAAVDLNITLLNADNFIVRVNGITVPSPDNLSQPFLQTVNLVPGTNTIELIASRSGATTTKIINLTLTGGGAEIFNVLPADGSVSSTGTITLSGNVVNTVQNELKIFVNGETGGTVLSFDSQGRFSREIKLVSGNNTITITASDGVNPPVSKTITVSYSTNPVIVINSPQNNAWMTTSIVTITGYVFNTQVNGFTINGETVVFNSKSGAFSKTINLKNINTDISFRAVNGKQITQKTLSLYYSGTPEINVYSPANGATVDSADVIFEGSVFPASPDDIITFTIKGVECKTLISDGYFRSMPITLDKAGENNVQLVLRTKDNREVTRTVKVNYNDGPTINIESPLDGTTLYTNVVTVKGKLARADFDTLKIGDKKPFVSSNGTFSQTVNLKEGKNDIKISASYGKATSNKTITVYYNQVAKEGAQVRIQALDNAEIKAFNEYIKLKLPKGSIGGETFSVISVCDPQDTEEPTPDQSAFIGPLFKVEWDGPRPVEPFKLTLKYDNVVSESQVHKISILYFDEVEDEWVISGGIVDSRSKTVSLEIDREGYYAASLYFITFSDVRNHWAQKDIEFIAARGAVKAAGQFKPDTAITRAEFVTFLVKSLGLTIYEQDNPSYNDVDDDYWAYDYIETALRAGIVTGVSRTKFQPDRTITREEAAIILVRAANLKPLKQQELNKILSSFGDADQVSHWAKTDVATAIKSKILNGTANGKFMPQNTTTRAQAAAMIARLAEYVNKNLR